MSKKLPEKTFLKLFEYVPRLALNILLVDDKKRPALAKRAIPPMKDYWHFPGSFQRKEESIGQCLRRVGKEELGIDVDVSQCKLLGAFDNLGKDPRGAHIVDLIFEYQISSDQHPVPTKENKEVKFFVKLPDQIGFNHRDILQSLGYN